MTVYDREIDISGVLMPECETCWDRGGWFESPDDRPLWKVPTKEAIFFRCLGCEGKATPDQANYSWLMGITKPLGKPSLSMELGSPIPTEPDLHTSHGRFQLREQKFLNDGRAFPKIRHIWWWLVHNAAAHLAIGLVPTKAAFRFHDWSSGKLNHK